MRAREYDPSDGRFLETDPLACDESCSSTYVYAEDDPTVKVDPSGEGAMIAGEDYLGANSLDPAVFNILGSCGKGSLPWCEKRGGKKIKVTFWSSGSFAHVVPKPGPKSHWTPEKIDTSEGWRICGWQHGGSCKDPRGEMKIKAWAYDEEFHGISLDHRMIRKAANWAKNRRSVEGIVAVGPGLHRNWPMDDPPGVHITAHFIEAYNSGSANPRVFSGWKAREGGRKHGVPFVAVREGSLFIKPSEAARYVYSVCSEMKGKWIGIWAEAGQLGQGSGGLDSEPGKVIAIDNALNACSEGRRSPYGP